MNIISIIALLGTAQGVFLTLTLFAWQKGNRRANAILAIIFALMSLAMWNVYLNTSGLYRTLTFSIRVYDALRLLTGPLIYWYVREMVVRPLRWRDSWHLLPTLVYIVWLVPFFMSSDAEKIRFMEQTLEGASYQYVVFAALRPWWTLGYMIAALRLLMEYSRRIKERFASLEVVGLQWLWNIVLGLSAMTVMVALAGVGTLWGMVRPNQINHAMAIAAALWVYGLAYFALRKTIVYSAELRQLLAEPLDFPTAPPLLLKEGSIVAQSNLGLLPIFARTNTADIENDIAADVQQMEQDVKHLLQFMKEQHPYLEHQLTLQKLALLTGFPAYRISDILNKHLSLNFFDFVNRYRIDEWKRRAQEAPQSITIQELAYSVGFNSKSSFNAAFKKHTGQTPSEYRAHYGME